MSLTHIKQEPDTSPPTIKHESPPRLSRTPICPPLPPELWIRILSYHNDLTHLWCTCRRVSALFRDYVEQVFAESHLKDTSIDFLLEKYNLGGKSRRPEIPTSFARFSQDKYKYTVYFRDKRPKKDVTGGGSKKEKGEYERVMQRWADNILNIMPEMPNYTIRVGNMVNDTVLPGLGLRSEEREIGFDWRGMFQAFFREQERLRIMKERWNVEIEKTLAENRVRLAKGEKLSLSDMPPSWQTVEIQYRKEIRRKRLKEHYQHHHHYPCNEAKVWALDSLKYYEESKATDGRDLKALSEIPGAGMGEKWFGSTYLLQGLYLDEWSCLHRIDNKIDQLGSEVC